MHNGSSGAPMPLTLLLSSHLLLMIATASPLIAPWVWLLLPRSWADSQMSFWTSSFSLLFQNHPNLSRQNPKISNLVDFSGSRTSDLLKFRAPSCCCLFVEIFSVIDHASGFDYEYSASVRTESFILYIILLSDFYYSLCICCIDLGSNILHYRI